MRKNDEKIRDPEWPDSWHQIEDDIQRDTISKELILEMPDDHILSGKLFYIIGKRDDNDDILAIIHENKDFYAEIHLTWSGKSEIDARWPKTKVYGSFEEWKNASS